MGKLDFADHALGQVDHFLISRTVTSVLGRFLSLQQRQGFPQRLSEGRIALIEPRLVEEQLRTDHLDHVGTVIGNRIKQVQRFQLCNGQRVLLGAAIERLKELRLCGQQCVAAGRFHGVVSVRQLFACPFPLIVEFGQLLFQFGDAFLILLFQRLAPARQTAPAQAQARIDEPLALSIADQHRAAAHGLLSSVDDRDLPRIFHGHFEPALTHRGVVLVLVMVEMAMDTVFASGWGELLRAGDGEAIQGFVQAQCGVGQY
ncbi:hypothetical protein D3C84_387710 [compost metagenome]